MLQSFLQICSNCNARLEFKISSRGKTVNCKSCSAEFIADLDPMLLAEDYRRIVRILAFAGQSDGSFDGREHAVVKSFIDEWLSYNSAASVDATMREGLAGKHLRLPRSLGLRSLLATGLVELVAADGVVDPKEVKVLKKLSAALGVEQDTLVTQAFEMVVDQMVADFDDDYDEQADERFVEAAATENPLKVSVRPASAQVAQGENIPADQIQVNTNTVQPQGADLPSTQAYNKVIVVDSQSASGSAQAQGTANANTNTLSDADIDGVSVDETISLGTPVNNSQMHQAFINEFLPQLSSQLTDKGDIEAELAELWLACAQSVEQMQIAPLNYCWQALSDCEVLICEFGDSIDLGELVQFCVILRPDTQLEVWMIEIIANSAGLKQVAVSTIRNNLKLTFYKIEMASETQMSEFLKLIHTLSSNKA